MRRCGHREAWRGACGCWSCGGCNDSGRCANCSRTIQRAAERTREHLAREAGADEIRRMRAGLAEDVDELAGRMMRLIVDGPLHALIVAAGVDDDAMRQEVHLLRHGGER